VVAMLLGEAWLFRSLLLVKYALLVFVLFHLFVVLYEERTLESRFGESYRLYRKAVPRWGFTVRPYSGNTGTNNRARR
jgi:protein-S-isoprenylcysteine O-methyltransferase Ste14